MTTTQEQNLKVLTEHLTELASRQQAAGGRIKVAGESVHGGVAGDVLRTHGVVCSLSSFALMKAEAARRVASAHQYKLSEHLAESLKNAADNYNNVDYREGRSIAECSV